MALSNELKHLLEHALPDALVGENRVVKFLSELDDRLKLLEQVEVVEPEPTTTVTP